MAEKNNVHKVTRGAISLLVSCLTQPGWAKTPPHMYAAGDLQQDLDQQFGEDKEPEGPNAETSSKQWADKPVELKLNEPEREACKAALTHFCEQGMLLPGPHFNVLGKALGLS